MQDNEILDLYFARDEQALAQTDKKYGQYCRTIAMNILHDRMDTEECVSDTYLHAWNAIPPQRPNVFSAFLGRITRNLSFDRFKAASAQKRGGGSLPLALEELGECVGADDTQQAFDERELVRVIDAFLRTLSERERGVFLRRYWYVDSIRDIAKQYAMNENSVKSILLRTREKLRRELLKEGIAV